MKKKFKEILKTGGVGIVLTDTLYGILGSALNKKTVERIYKIKGRNKNKPFIILISSISDLNLFGIKLTPYFKKELKKFWPVSAKHLGKPDPTSIILPLSGLITIRPDFDLSKSRIPTEVSGLKADFYYLHQGTKSLAFRLPKNKRLISVLKETGPLVAPSANPQGKDPARSIKAAKKYFRKKVDFYEDSGVSKKTRPSTLIKIDEDKKIVLRK